MTPTVVRPRVSPILPAAAAGAAAPEGPSLTVALGGSDSLEIWEDRVVTPDAVYPFDECFGVRLVGHPMAPMTIEAPLAIGLLTGGAYWAAYAPAREADALRALYAIRAACHRRGLVPLGGDEPAGAQPLWRKVGPRPAAPGAKPAPIPAHAPIPAPAAYPRDRQAVEGPRATVPTPAPAPSPAAGRSDALLAALAHASVLFLPVLLPALIWATAGRSAPRVARQAFEAVIFQGCVVALGTVLLAALSRAAAGAHAGDVGLSLVALAALAAAAGGWGCAAAVRALRGEDYRYLGG